jgi:hypothetical protein
LGLLYKARAEVALLADDTEQFGRDVEKMESHFRRTNNPNLIGQWEHLVSHAGSAAQRNVAIESLAALIAISPDSAQATVRDLSPGMSLEGEATVREPVSAKR